MSVFMLWLSGCCAILEASSTASWSAPAVCCSLIIRTSLLVRRHVDNVAASLKQAKGVPLGVEALQQAEKFLEEWDMGKEELLALDRVLSRHSYMFDDTIELELEAEIKNTEIRYVLKAGVRMSTLRVHQSAASDVRLDAF